MKNYIITLIIILSLSFGISFTKLKTIIPVWALFSFFWIAVLIGLFLGDLGNLNDIK